MAESIELQAYKCDCGCGRLVTRRSDGIQPRYRKGHKNGNSRGTNDPIETTCAFCGVFITVERWRAERFGIDNVFCSRDCQGKGRSEKAKVLMACFHCGNHFWEIPSRKQCKRIFCSHGCFNSQREQEPDSKIEMSCDQCGKAVRIWPCIHKLNDHFFCSRECYSEYVCGANNPAYTGGLGRHPYYGANWRKQRRRARKRDKDTCQRCDAQPLQPRMLEVHHVVPFVSFEGDWKKANEVDNLITYCVDCHELVEKAILV